VEFLLFAGLGYTLVWILHVFGVLVSVETFTLVCGNLIALFCIMAALLTVLEMVSFRLYLGFVFRCT
jgi:hypothetical protein